MMPAGVGYDTGQFGGAGGGGQHHGQFGGGEDMDFSKMLAMGAGKESSGFDFSSLLKDNFKFNFLLPAGLQAGTSLLSGMFNLIGGIGRRREAKQDFEGAKGDLESFSDEDAFNPFLIDALSTGALHEEVGSIGERLDSNLELDSGEAQGALFSSMLNKRRLGLASNLKERGIRKDLKKQRTLEALFSQAAQNPDLYG